MAELHENLLGETVSTPIGRGRVAAITRDEQGFHLLVELSADGHLVPTCLGQGQPGIRVERPRKIAIQFGFRGSDWYAWSLRSPFTFVGPQSTMEIALANLARKLDTHAPRHPEGSSLDAAAWLAAHASVRFVGEIPDKLLATFNAPST